MGKAPAIRWLELPEDKDYAAAESFLSMLVAPASLPRVIAQLRTPAIGHWAAKDVLRAAGLAPLKPKRSVEVTDELRKIKDETPISPILTVGGLRDFLIIADGYHRASAAYAIREDSMVPGRLLWLGDRASATGRSSARSYSS